MRTRGALTGALALLGAAVAVAAPASQFVLGDVRRGGLRGGVRGGARGDLRGAVASESKECTAIGRDLLARGGNAVDALVGTTFCVGVISMYHSGIGGGGFALVRDSDGGYEAVDFRETAPAAAFAGMYYGNPNGSLFGGLAVAVPGELRGLEYMHTKYGSLEWKEVIRGAVHIARNGFVVTHDLLRYMEYALLVTGDNFLVDDPAWAVDFAPNGTLVGLGDWMTRKRYADTLELIGEHGADFFYSGPLASSVVDAVQRKNGTMTLEDLRQYNISVRPPLSATYRGRYRIVTTPAPSSGAVALQILKIMEQYAPGDVPIDVGDTAVSGLTYHRINEAMRFAYAARRGLADPDFISGTDEIEREMLDADTLKAIRAKILDDRTQPLEAYNPDGVMAPDSHGTSQVVTADRSGMAVSLTTTINSYFASLVIDPVSGVILNNEMNDFSIPESGNYFELPVSPANYVAPGKRPLSSISPLIIERIEGNSSSLAVVVGAAGGSRIPSSTAQVAWRVIEHGLDMAQALARRRLHDQLLPATTYLETGFDPSVVEALTSRGHNITWLPEGVSSAHGIVRAEDGQFEAAGEPRMENSAGYTI